MSNPSTPGRPTTGSSAPRLIGLASHAAQSGKSTVARTLIASEGFSSVPLAAPLKRMVTEFLWELGTMSEGQIAYAVYVDRSTVVPGLGVTTRHLLQTLGTEWGRQCVCPDVWLRCWSAAAEDLLAAGRSVVVDDVRFPDEADFIRERGGELWLIDRGLEADTNHASEGGLRGYPHFSCHINNKGVSLEELQEAVLTALSLSGTVHTSQVENTSTGDQA